MERQFLCWTTQCQNSKSTSHAIPTVGLICEIQSTKTLECGLPGCGRTVQMCFGTESIYLHEWDLSCEVEVIPRDEPRPRPPPSGLGMPPLLGRLLGLLLLPRNRFCVGDAGDLTSSVVFGRADRLRGCVPSSCGSGERSVRENRCE